MRHFFLTDGSLTEESREVTITGEDARHIALALRARVGDPVLLADGTGLSYPARLAAITPAAVRCEVLSHERATVELPLAVHLYVGYPKGDKLELVIEKAVELGAASVTPFLSSRCVRRPAAEKQERLLERQNRIAHAAAEQCGRVVLPTVRPTLDFAAAMKKAASAELPLFFYEGEGTLPMGRLLASRPAPRSVSVVVGPEGGFSPEEVAVAQGAGCLLAGLGERILRCETAPIAALACLGFYYDFGKND